MINSRKRPLEEATAAAEKKPKGTRPERVHYGLYNQGSTCYLNSVLQVLFMTKEINERLRPKSKSTDKELGNIFEKMKERTCGTQNITQCLEIINVNQQRDAAECLEMILQRVSPKASEVFQGQLAYTTKCSKGHSINEETNPFWTLPLSLKHTHDATYSVEQNFKRFFQTKTFSGDDVVHCDECKEKTEATSGCEMVESPQILTLLLKRFDFDYNTMSHVKSDRCVGVPLVLQTKNKTYKLYGMVNHVGSLRGGHYTAIIRSDQDKTWYEFSDTRVNKVEEQPFEKNETYNSSTAYLIVYRASGSLREKVKDRQHEHPDEQRGCREEQKRRHGESDAHGKENRRNQESQVRKERSKEALSLQGRGEGGEARRDKKVSSVKEVEDDLLLLGEKQKASHWSKQHPDDWTKADKRKLRSKKEEGENQPRKCSFDITKNPILIAVIVVGCMIIGIVIVVLVV